MRLELTPVRRGLKLDCALDRCWCGTFRGSDLGVSLGCGGGTAPAGGSVFPASSVGTTGESVGLSG